jgi:hypothetical protein
MIDPITGGILSGLVANALTSLVKRQPGKLFVAAQKSQSRQDLTDVIQQLSDTARQYPISESTREAIQRFLTTPEASSIAQQIFASQITNSSSPGLAEIKREFERLLQLHANLTDPDEAPIAGTFFDIIVAHCVSALSRAVDRGELTAHEALSNARHHVLLSELASVRRNLDFLLRKTTSDIQDYLAFERRYRSQVFARHSTITPPYIDIARKVAIDELFVGRDIIRRQGNEQVMVSEGDFSPFGVDIVRAVLLGDPGGGKSTLAEKLCHALAEPGEEGSARLWTPIFITLRDYAFHKKTRFTSILQFIESLSNTCYQIEPPPGFFEYLLLNGRAFVVFDGLDELLDTSERQTISSDVESFVHLYPLTPVLITSRVVGYEKAPLNEELFSLLELRPFTETQAVEYAWKWFLLNTPDSAVNEAARRSQAFLSESRVAADLRSNPLLLGLMCNLYRGIGYIPRNRPDVFSKCAEMLFERWDRSRGIYFRMAAEALVRPCLMYLAWWIYTTPDLRSGVAEDTLEAKVAEYLLQRRFGRVERAERAAEEFVEFFRGRAWVFCDTGTTARGTRLYQFTHGTFLEYFTALHFIRTCHTPADLLSQITPKVQQREWDNVVQLTTQLYDRSSEGGGDLILRHLLSAATPTKPASLNCLSFTARALHYLTPKAATIHEIAYSCLKNAANILVPRWSDPVSTGAKAEALSLITDLFSCSEENRDFVAFEARLWITAHLRNSATDADFAAELLSIPALLRTSEVSNEDPQATEFWTAFGNSLLREKATALEPISRRNALITVQLAQRGLVSIPDLTKTHGVESFFVRHDYRYFSAFSQDSLALSVLLSLYTHDGPLPYLQAHEIAIQMEKSLKEAKRPWCCRSGRKTDTLLRFWRASPDEEKTTLTHNSPELRFAALLLVIGLLDGNEESRAAADVSFPDVFVAFRHLLRARYGNGSIADAREELSNSTLSDFHKQWLLRWAGGG